MAVRHRLVEAAVADVWRVLADPSRYSDWVVGTSDSRPRNGSWPEVGSSLTYALGIGRWSVQGRTVVRRCEAPHVLELEADSGWIGTARIALEIRQWGDDALVTLDEHPLRGPAGKLHNTVVDALIQLRHRSVLARLAQTVETSPKGTREEV
ncbi:SRPBCC family protein [Streptomyces sp. NPDC087866]|uniref:SRPBCC family protein n=1 Tax=unclassified Streptomyces TaxID=2593676 RepID=UPI0011CE6B0A|nr:MULTISPECIES: SRPBCC family protein [unclassified Streptomyces]MCX4446321.1 SRPBCC family protein [Streptomyces sp. NBC_01789]TXS04450.1 SRPBCC family protein [Streptomyces sp. col6]